LTRLDLRGVTELQRGYAVQLDEIAEELRLPYVELVQAISAPYGADVDWWVTPFASRNTYVCHLFERLCKVTLARRIAAEGGVLEVIVDTPELARLLQKVLPASVSVRCTISPLGKSLRVAAAVMRRLAIALYMYAGRTVFSRLLPPVRRDLPLEPVVILDTFVYPESIRAGIFTDRHYPGLLDELTESERRIIYRAPTYYGVRNYFQLYHRLRACKDNFLLPDDYLHLADYVFAISHIWRASRQLPKCTFSGMEVTGLVNEAYTENLANPGSAEGLLRYCFAQRLRDAGIRVHRVVEWFENQELDHGAVAGWRKFYPNVEVMGYQGFLASRTYLCMFPVALEQQLNLLPHTLAVIGGALVGPAKEFCPDLRVIVAPAFRFQALMLDRRDEPSPGWFTVLISLPVMKDESAAVMAMLVRAAKILDGVTSRPCRFHIKLHPASQKKAILDEVLRLSPVFRVIDGDFDRALDDADALVSAASSTCVQAIARGVPVAIVGRPGLLTQNPIPKTVDSRLWQVCYSAGDLSSALRSYADLEPEDMTELRKLGSDCRSELFEPLTSGASRAFVGLEQAQYLPE